MTTRLRGVLAPVLTPFDDKLAADVGRFSLDNQLVTVGPDPHRELYFELLEVFVVSAVERFGPFVGNRNLAHDCGRRDG